MGQIILSVMLGVIKLRSIKLRSIKLTPVGDDKHDFKKAVKGAIGYYC